MPLHNIDLRSFMQEENLKTVEFQEGFKGLAIKKLGSFTEFYALLLAWEMEGKIYYGWRHLHSVNKLR